MPRIQHSVIALFCVFLLAACSEPDTASQHAPVKASGDAAAATKPAPAAQMPNGAGCKLTMGWDPWEPYQYYDVNGSVIGLDVEIVTAIAGRAGCELAFKQEHWAKLLTMLRAGEVDFLPGATRTAARDAFALFSDPYRDESFSLYVRAGEAEDYAGATLEDLLKKGFRIGVTNDYVYGDQVTSLESDPRYSDRFHGVSIGELNFEKLSNMEIDGFLEDPFVAAAMMRKRDLADAVETSDIVLDRGDVHLMFGRKSVDQATVDKINTGLKAIRSDGTYQKLLDKYRS